MGAGDEAPVASPDPSRLRPLGFAPQDEAGVGVVPVARGGPSATRSHQCLPSAGRQRSALIL